VDYCTMDYNDLSADPQKFGDKGNMCDDLHECAWCFMICPTGAINLEPDIAEHMKLHIGKRKVLFETILNQAEKDGKFRRYVPFEDVGLDTPYCLAHPKRPYFAVPPKPEED